MKTSKRRMLRRGLAKVSAIEAYIYFCRKAPQDLERYFAAQRD